MRTNRKRVPLPFLFRAADGLGADGKVVARSYGNVIEGVFTRAGTKYAETTDGSLWPVAHSRVPFGVESGQPVLALDSAAPTNLIANASDFSNASWVKTNITVSANSTVAPDGTTTADTLTTGTAFGGYVNSGITAFTSDGTKWGVVYLQQSGTVAYVDVTFYDFTAGVIRHNVRVTWVTGGVPTLQNTTGTGPSQVRRVRDTNWFRVLVGVAGVIAANTNQCQIAFPSNAPTSAVIVWQAFASNTVPGSAIEVGRVADVLYFPFALPPQHCTIYVRGVEHSTPNVADPSNAQVYLTLGDNNGDPRLLLYRETTTTGYVLLHDPATSTQTTTSAIGTAATYGDLVELRGVLGPDGSCTLGVSVGSAAEATNGPSAAQALGSAWNVNRLYLHSTLAGANPVNFAFTHVAVALGTKTMAEMRDLAEVT